jgi:hypothetical protein
MKIRLFFLGSVTLSAALLFSAPARSQTDCFFEDFTPKTAEIPPHRSAVKPSNDPTAVVSVSAADTIGRVSKYLYGNNANTYMTQMVTQRNLIDRIALLSPNIIRYPGGSLSDVFFWNARPGVPPSDAPAQLVDGATGQKSAAGWWYGRNGDGWTLSVDNYYEMLDQTWSTGILTMNYGYARYGTGPDPAGTAARNAADWVRYDDGRTRFWEIGNENYGQWEAGYQIDPAGNRDGQPAILDGELYGRHFKAFADSMRRTAEDIGAVAYIGAVLKENAGGASVERDWDAGFFRSAGDAADFFIVHSYFTPYNQNSTPSVILNSAATETRAMMSYLKQVTQASGAAMKPVALTEWNTFATGSKQNCSFIAGMHAALVLGELAKNRYSMASRWDLANGYDNGNDHGLFNNRDEPGVPDWNPRPAYYYMYYFQNTFGDMALNAAVTGSRDIAAYASRFGSGQAGVVVVNKGASAQTVRIDLDRFRSGAAYYVTTLTGGTDNGEFSQQVFVNGTPPDNDTGGPIDGLESIEALAFPVEGGIRVESPPRSVEYVLIEGDGPESVNMDESRRPPAQDRVRIYPNPVRGSFRISVRPAAFDRVEILNIRGQVMTAKAIHPSESTAEITERLPSGMYFARLTGGSKQGNPVIAKFNALR